MEANLDYWRGSAKIETLVWEFIQDPQTRLNALLDGSAQAIDRVPPEHLPLLEERDDVDPAVSVTGIESVNLCVRPRPPAAVGRERRLPQGGQLVDRPPAAGRQPGARQQRGAELPPERTRCTSRRSSRLRLRPGHGRHPARGAGVRRRRTRVRAVGGRRVPPALPRSCRRSSPRWSRSASSRGSSPPTSPAMIDDIFTEGGTGAMYHLSWASSGDPHHAAAVYSSAVRLVLRGQHVAGADRAGRDHPGPGAARADLRRRSRRTCGSRPGTSRCTTPTSPSPTPNLTGVLVQPNVFRTDFYTAELVG